MAILATVRGLVPTLLRNRRLVALFILMVLLPAFVFSLLIVRAIGNEQLRLAYETIERQKQVVGSAEADLNAWLFSAGSESARSRALLRFETTAGQILFPDYHLSLPAVGAPRLRPFDAAPPAAQLDAESVTAHYYPRVQVFLRDISAGRHAGAQYFLRLRALVVRPPGASEGYVVDVQHVVEHVNRRLAELSASHPFTARVSVAEADRKTTPVVDTYGLGSFPFFEVVFNDPLLRRIMVTVVVNPARIQGVNEAGALALQRYLLEPGTQANIRQFRHNGLLTQTWAPAGRNNAGTDLMQFR